jgi:hypothetical protein
LLNVPVLELRTTTGDGTVRTIDGLSGGLTTLADAIAQPWVHSGHEEDYYKDFGLSTGMKSSTLWFINDNGVSGPCNSGCAGGLHQTDCYRTPNGLISYGYTDGANFVDFGNNCNDADARFIKIIVRKLEVCTLEAPTEAPTSAPTASPTATPPCTDTPPSTAAKASELVFERAIGAKASLEFLEDGVLRIAGATCLQAELCNTCGFGGGSSAPDGYAELQTAVTKLQRWAERQGFDAALDYSA